MLLIDDIFPAVAIRHWQIFSVAIVSLSVSEAESTPKNIMIIVIEWNPKNGSGESLTRAKEIEELLPYSNRQ